MPETEQQEIGASDVEDVFDKAGSAAEAKAKDAKPPAAAEPADLEVEEEEDDSRPDTKYMVLTSDAKTGPWNEYGIFEGKGQPGAKRAAAEKLGKEEAEKLHFIAIPLSSYQPQKPTLKLTITFS